MRHGGGSHECFELAAAVLTGVFKDRHGNVSLQTRYSEPSLDAAPAPRGLGLAVAVSGLLVACGGGPLVLLPFVGAIGGSWVGGVQAAGAWQPADPPQSLNFLEPPFPADLYSAADAEFPAILSGLATNCGGANDTPQRRNQTLTCA
jgi:hypothetical protein